MISVKGISKSFESFNALDDVTCDIKDGCIYGMVGSNGAGKSTFLRILTGVYKADKGSVEIDGNVVYENPVAKSDIMFVPDELFFLPSATMKKMAKFYNGIYDRFDYERFNSLTKIFGLNPDKNIFGFSKGMKRQAAIILALSTRSKYMFFDETFDGLDPVMRALVKKLIYNDVEQFNSTVIITSHSLRELEDICDHLALLHKGGVVIDSDVVDLKTTQFKVQVAFKEPFTQDKFKDLNITRYRSEGSVASMIINGDREQTVAELKEMNPILLDVLPLTLEEIFTYEMEALGYNFDNAWEENSYE